MLKQKLSKLIELKEYIPNIEIALKAVEDEFEEYEKTELIKDNSESKDIFEKLLEELYSFVLYENLPDTACSLIMELSEVLFNWNRLSRTRSKKVTLSTLMLNRVLEVRELMLKQSMLIKDVEKKLREFNFWLPPAFSISKAYLDELLNKNEGICSVSSEQTIN